MRASFLRYRRCGRRWPGKKIDLRKFSAAHSEAISPAATLLRERHSTRSFDDQRPITLAELSRFLDSTARVQSRLRSRLDLGDGGPVVTYAVRPYPSGGGCYELELYLAVDKCEGLARGFYHYDAGGHALVPIDVRRNELEALLTGAEFAMGAPAAPQILITIAARFGRISWKYSSIAYALILKDVGVLIQTLYMMATDMGLGGCAIGSANIDLFAKMTGIEFHVEGPVGQFAIGRGTKPGARQPLDPTPPTVTVGRKVRYGSEVDVTAAMEFRPLSAKIGNSAFTQAHGHRPFQGLQTDQLPQMADSEERLIGMVAERV